MSCKDFYCALGMRRSGHHAVLNWILAHYDGPTAHFNDQTFAKPRFGRKPDVLIAAIANFEEMLIVKKTRRKMISESNFIQYAVRQLGQPDRVLRLLVLRDPFNVFASRIKHRGLRGGTLRRLGWSIRLWKSHAREFFGKSRLLFDVLPVSYNRWFSDEQYRRALSNNLGLKFSDAGLQKIASRARGSSFDGYEMDGKCQQMDVLNRWRAMKEEHHFIKVMREFGKDVEAVKLTNKLFPELSAQVWLALGIKV